MTDTTSISHPVHEVFVKDNPHSLLGNALEKSRLPQAQLIHSEDEKEGLDPDSSRSSPEESELSSIDESSVSNGYSTGPLQTSKREGRRNNLSPSPDSAEDQAGGSDAPKKRAPAQPSEKGEWVAPEKRGPAKPQNEPCSGEERAPASYSRLLQPEILRQSEGAVASESQHEIGSTRDYHASTWSPQEIEILTTLTRGLHRSADIDFKHIAAQMPDPSRRTVDACRRFWDRHVKSRRPSQGTLSNPAPALSIRQGDSSRKVIPGRRHVYIFSMGDETDTESPQARA